VTRSEMAVIMALLLNLDYQYYEATCPFNDVPSWARPYVGACYANKIVSGYDANTYGSNDGVTPVQAASMMMRALGYFKYDVDYSDGFETATVRQGTSIGIFDGVGSSANVAMTRNQVARMALNALQCGMVEPDGNSLSITTPDGFTVAQGRTNYVYVIGRDNRVATAINDKTASSGTGNSGLNGYILDLGEQLYNGDLRKTSVNDGFGAPATRWAYKNAEVGTYADEADYTLEGTVKSSAMYTTVGKTVAEDYTWEVYMDGAHNVSGIRGFLEAVDSLAKCPSILLFSMVQEKDYEEASRLLCQKDRWERIILTKISGNARALDPECLKSCMLRELSRAGKHIPVLVIECPREAYREAMEQKKPGQKLFCAGSLYLIGELKNIAAGT